MGLYIGLSVIVGLGVFFMVNAFNMSSSERKNIYRDGDSVKVKGTFAEASIFQEMLADLSLRIQPEEGNLEEKIRKSGGKFSSITQYHARRLFYALMFVVVGVAVGVITGGNVLVASIVATGGAIFGFTTPKRMLDAAIRKRREILLNEMGFALDTVARNLEIGVDMAETLGNIGLPGMFANACSKLGTAISMKHSFSEAVERARYNIPDTAQFDEFLMLVQSAIQKGGQMSDSFKVIARVLRERQRLEIIRTANAAKVKVVLVTSVVIMLANIIVTAGPSFAMLTGMGAF